MMKEIYKINNEGIYVDCYWVNLEENTYYNGEDWLKIDFNYVEVQPPNAKSVKWENNMWVIIEDYLVEPQQPREPTELEILNTLGQELAQLKLQFMMGGM